MDRLVICPEGVVHIDGNTKNNAASNLRWATPEEMATRARVVCCTEGVIHIDGDKTNWWHTNLRWATVPEIIAAREERLANGEDLWGNCVMRRPSKGSKKKRGGDDDFDVPIHLIMCRQGHGDQPAAAKAEVARRQEVQPAPKGATVYPFL